MNQVQTYSLLNQYELSPEEIGLIFQACLNYLTFQDAAELSNKVLEDRELNAGFKPRPPQPTYTIHYGPMHHQVLVYQPPRDPCIEIVMGPVR